MSGEDIRRALRRISHEILERHRGVGSIVLVGIHTRGAHLADRLGELIHEYEGAKVPVGTLEVSPYRDDLQIRPREIGGTTEIAEPIEGKCVILVDDVLYTGRTVRAGLDALTDIGRAAQTELAILVDRGHRELPIRADYVGKNLPTSNAEVVRVRLTPVDSDEGVWVEQMAHV